VNEQGPGATRLALSRLIGGAAVGANVIRVGPVTAQAVVAIVSRPGADVPLPVPDATSGGSVDNPKLTLPVNARPWALVANPIARPTAETNFNNPSIEELLLCLDLVTSFEGAEETQWGISSPAGRIGKARGTGGVSILKRDENN
jgi:hypothetical protein